MKRLGLAIALVVALSCAAAAQIGGLMFPGPGPRIASAALACSYTPVTTGTQGTAYTGATPSASGGTPAYTFSETGTLPGGLSISSSTGVISGTPTANGSFPTIQVKVTDSTSTVANCGASFTLVIAPSATYTGPGDVASAAAWWGTQAYSAATRGNRVVNACNSTGGIDISCADLSTSATTGLLVSATIGGITCPGANCTVKIAYDQSGANNCSGAACDASQSTVANRPSLPASCISGLPCMQCNGTSALVSPTPTTIAQPFTVAGVVVTTSPTGSFLPWYGDSGENVEMDTNSGVDTVLLGTAAFSVTSVLTINSPFVLQGVFNGSSSVSVYNGTTSTGNPGTSSAAGAHNICANDNGGDRHFIGNVGEEGIWPIGFNSTQYGNINTLERAVGRWNF